MKTDKRLWRNRKAKKELAWRLQSENPGLEVVHPHAAGIDVGKCPLRGGAARLRSGTGAPVWVLHRRSSSVGALVAKLRSEDCGLTVDGRILDPLVRHFGRTGFRGLSGQRAAQQEPARTQERCGGKPVGC
jgi:hypothetical protein